jgi:hypothetical protein
MPPNIDPGRFGRGFFGPGPYHDSGPTSIEWALLALLLVSLGLLVWLTIDSVQRRKRFQGRGQRQGQGWRGGPGGQALAVARMRYARGEMSREEFLQASEDLTATSPGSPPPPEAPAEPPPAPA